LSPLQDWCPLADYTDTKGKGIPAYTMDGAVLKFPISMHWKTFSLRLREISHHTGILSGRFPIPTAGILPNGRYYLQAATPDQIT
jgi:hypothetical protein